MKFNFFDSFKKKQEYVSIPFKTPRIIILFSSVFITSTISLAWANSDAFQKLLLDNGSFDFPDFTIEDKKKLCSYVANIGFSSVLLFGLVSGPFLKLVGSRYCSMVGVLLVAFAYVCLFFLYRIYMYYVAAISLGLAFQLLLAPHVESAILYPDVSNFVVGFIASGNDISYFTTVIMQQLTKKMSVKAVVWLFLTCLCLPSLILSFLFCPDVPFSEQVKKTKEEQIDFVKQRNLLEEGGKEVTVEANINPLEILPATKQILQVEFWMIVLYLAINYLRKKHMATQHRYIFEQLAGPSSGAVSDVLNLLLPFGFLFSIFWSSLVDRFGVISLTYVSNTIALAYLIFQIIPVIPLQYVTIILFLIVQSFVYNHMLACLSVIFGVINISNLQGYVSSITGVILIIWDYVFYHFFESVLDRNFTKANIFLIVLSLVAYLIPFFLWWKKKKRAQLALKQKQQIQQEHQTPQTSSLNHQTQLIAEKQ